MKAFIKRVYKYLRYGVPVKQQVVANVVTIDKNKLLEGRVALITGGTSGIGKSIAIAFARGGAKVVITGRTKAKVDGVVDIINHEIGKTCAYGIQLDNTKPDTFESKVHEIISNPIIQRIDILVNNAGLCGGDITNATVEDFDAVISTNLRGSFFLSRVVARYMRDNNIKGNILNIASSSSLRPAASAYTFSKWGLRGFTLGLAKTLAPYGIVVNGIAPGPTATPMLHRDASDITFEKNPSGRFAMPEEIANMAVVLTSGMGRMVIGDIVYMTGGSGLITFDDIPYNLG